MTLFNQNISILFLYTNVQFDLNTIFEQKIIAVCFNIINNVVANVIIMASPITTKNNIFFISVLFGWMYNEIRRYWKNHLGKFRGFIWWCDAVGASEVNET